MIYRNRMKVAAQVLLAALAFIAIYAFLEWVFGEGSAMLLMMGFAVGGLYASGYKASTSKAAKNVPTE